MEEEKTHKTIIFSLEKDITGGGVWVGYGQRPHLFPLCFTPSLVITIFIFSFAHKNQEK